ncbi:MAG: acetylxylan esterase [Bryobacteraceae bacterium]
MRFSALLLTMAAFSQTPPPLDSRNTDIPHTDTHFSPKAFWRYSSHGTLPQWEERKAFLRRQILSAAGLDPLPPKAPLNPIFTKRMERDGYVIENVLLETYPGYYLGGNLFRPLGKKGKFPGILLAHGHADNGRLENTELASPPSFGISMARQGYVVFSYDMVGWNDTKQTIHEFGGPRELIWGFGPLGVQLWNSIRVLDFLQSLEDVDPERIAMTGWSGGGTQTFVMTAVDDRVKVSAPVDMVSAVMQGGSPCENAPRMRIDTYNVEIAALAAPRPMIVVSSPWDQSRFSQPEINTPIRGIYYRYGKPHLFEGVEVEAQHNYNRESREAVYRFFGKHLLNETDATKFQERPMVIEKPEDMLALTGRKLPDNAKTYDQLFQWWREMAVSQSEQTTDLNVLRQRMKITLSAETPGRLLTEPGENGHLVIGRYDKRDRIPAQWLPGAGAPLLFVHEGGVAAAAKHPEVKKAIAAKRPVLLIDAFQTGSAVAIRDRSARYFLVFNKSDDANRVQDILTSIAFLQKQSQEKIELRGVGKAGVWCLFAASVSQAPLRLHADLNGFTGKDEDFLRAFLVPGIQRAGGLDAAMRLTASMRQN